MIYIYTCICWKPSSEQMKCNRGGLSERVGLEGEASTLALLHPLPLLRVFSLLFHSFFFQRSMAPTSVLYVLHANPAHQCSGCLCLIWINETFHMFFYSSSVFLTNLEQCFDVSHSMYIYSTCRPDLPCRFAQQINQSWHASITHLRQTFCPKWHSNYFFDGLKEPGFYLTSISKRIHHRNGQIEHVVDICLQISFLSILKPSPSNRK